MKTSDRVALVYALSLFGAGAVSYYRGRRGVDLVIDTGLHGVVAGTGLNVVVFLAGEALPSVEVLSNPHEGPTGMGNIPAQAVSLLSQVDVERLYQGLKENGVKIAPVPDNPSVVMQDAT